MIRTRVQPRFAGISAIMVGAVGVVRSIYRAQMQALRYRGLYGKLEKPFRLLRTTPPLGVLTRGSLSGF